MVDDRYGWLDEDVAERLLRGEPLDDAEGAGRRGGRSWRPEERAAAERLAALLARAADAAATVPGENGRMPGEQAALAAFRAAREQRTALASEPLDRPERRSSVMERLRSLRVAVAVAVAACAIGGVAVASSTGVLPSPSFVEDTATRTPSVDTTGTEGGWGGGQDEEAAGGPSTGHGSDHKSDGSGKGADETGEVTAGQSERGVDGRVGPGANGQGVGELNQLCREFLAARDGKGPPPDKAAEQRLEQEAGSAEAVPDYCARRMGDQNGTGGGQGQPAPGPTNPTGNPTGGGNGGGSDSGGSGDGSESGNDDGGGDGGGEDTGGGSAPPEPNPNISQTPDPTPTEAPTATETPTPSPSSTA